jgi:hypothetical protein
MEKADINPTFFWRDLDIAAIRARIRRRLAASASGGRGEDAPAQENVLNGATAAAGGFFLQRTGIRQSEDV